MKDETEERRWRAFGDQGLGDRQKQGLVRNQQAVQAAGAQDGEKRCLSPGVPHSTCSFRLEKQAVGRVWRASQPCREGTECGKNFKKDEESEIAEKERTFLN